MIGYGSMYSKKIQIHPRHYRYPEAPPEKSGGTIAEPERKETPEEEKTRKEFLNNILDIIASRTNRKDAETILKAFKELKTNTDKVKKNLPDLEQHVLNLFNPDWSKKNNYLSRINEIKKVFGISSSEDIPQEWKVKFDEFKKNNPIQKYTDEIYDFIIHDPSIANGTYKKWDTLLDKKIAELDALGIWTNNEYRAVLITARDIAQGEYFLNNGWTTAEEQKMQKQIFETVVKDAFNTSVSVKKPQEMRWYSTKEFGLLSPEDEQILISHSPDKIYDYFLDGLNWLSKGGNITKEIVDWFIVGITWQLLPIIKKLWPDHALSKIYENKFTQMRALASYDILYDSWESMKWWFTGNSIDKFLIEAKKWFEKPWSIGFSDGVFKYYNVNEMEEAIMKTGEITWTYNSAWDSYIKGSKGDYTKLDWIFRKPSLEALAIYINEKKGNSTLVDKNDGFRTYINGKIPENYIVNTEKYWEKNEELTLEKDFPNLLKIIQTKWLKIPENLPKTQNGWIDGIQLIFAIIEWKSKPEIIEAVKAELDKDFENIKSGAKNKKWEISKSLEFTDWKKTLEYLDISNPLEWWSNITGDIDGSLDLEKRKALRSQLELKKNILLKEPQTPENIKKLETITKLITLIDAEKTASDASVAQSAMQQAGSKNMDRASWNKDAEMKLSKSVNANAQAIEEQKNNEDFTKRNALIIQKFSSQYGLPALASELANPQYLDQIKSIISELWAKKPLTEDERIFLDYLERTKGVIRFNSQSVLAHQELAKAYPEFQDTLSNIRQANKELYDNLTPQKLAQYEHIATYIFPENPVTRMTRDLANMPPWSELPLIRYYSDSDIWNGMRSSISLEDCRFTKDSVNSGTIHFPTYMGIPPMNRVPVQWIESFLSQADLFVRLWFQELIPQMKEINMQVSKKYWKWTNSFDGSFDIYELRRVTTVLFALVGIKLSGNETIPELTSKINANYPNNGDVRKKLKEIEILTEDSHFRKFEFEKQMAALNITI